MSSGELFEHIPGELIPDTVLRRTFSYLDIDEKLRCASVCKKWHRLLMKGRPWTDVRQIRFDEELRLSTVRNVTLLCPKLRTVKFFTVTVTTSTCLAINDLIDASPELDTVVFTVCQLRDVRELKFTSSLECLIINTCVDERVECIDYKKFKLLYEDLFQSLPVWYIILRTTSEIIYMWPHSSVHRIQVCKI